MIMDQESTINSTVNPETGGGEVYEDLIMALGSTSDFQKSLELILDKLSALEGIDCGGVYVVEPTSGDVQLRAHLGLSAGFTGEVSAFPPDSPQARLVEQGRPMFLGREEFPSRAQSLYRSEGLRAVAFIPVKSGGQTVASLNLASRSYDRIPLKLRDTLLSVAEKIGDMVRRSREETEIRNSRQEFIDILEHLQLGVAVVDSDMRELDINPRFRKIMSGYFEWGEQSAGEGLSKAERGNDFLSEFFSRTLSDGRNHEVTMPAEMDGNRVECQLITTPVRNSRGDIEGAVAIARLMGEDELKGKNSGVLMKLLDGVTEGSGLWVNILGRDMEVIYWNRRAEQISGYSAEEVMGDGRIWEWLYPDREYRRDIKERMEGIKSGEVDEDEEYRTVITTRDGGRRTISWNWTSLNGLGIADWGAVLFGRDISSGVREQRMAFASLDVSDEAVVLADQDRRIVWVNKAFTMHTGYSIREVKGKKFMKVCLDENCPDIHKAIREGLEADGRWRGEITGVRKDGSEFFMELTVSEMRGKNEGKPDYTISFIDILDRKMEERENRELMERLSRAFDGSPVPQAISTMEEGRFFHANNAFLELFGFSRDEVIGKTSLELDLIDSKTREEAIQILKDNGELNDFEIRWQRPDGKNLRILWSSQQVEMEMQVLLHSNFVNNTEKGRMEEELRRSEEKYRTLIENQGEGVGITNLEEEFIFANPAAEEIFGVGSGQLSGRSLYDFISRDEQDKIREQTALRSREKKSTYELEVIQPGGRKVDVLVTVTPQYDESGKVIGSLGIFRDITQRKRAEEEVRNFREALDCSSDAIGMSTPEGEHFYQNKSFDRLFGDIGSKAPSSLYADEAVGREVFDTIMRGEEWTGEVSMYGNHGRLIDVFLRAYPVRRSGKIIALAGVHTDITGRKRAENKLRMLSAVVEQSMEGFVIADIEGEITYANRTVERLYGYSPEELYGNPVFILNEDPEDRDEIQRNFLNRGYWSGEVEQKRKDGTTFPALLSLFIVKDQDGRVDAVVASVRDITQRKRAEEKLREKEQRLQLALKGGGLGTWDWNIRTGQIRFSQRWAEMLGYDVREIKTRLDSWVELVHPDDYPEARESLDAHLEGETPFYQATIRMKHKSGKWRWILDRGQVIERDKEGRPVRACGTHMDVTERTRAYQSLRKAEIERTTILDAQPTHVILQSPDLKIGWANLAACRSAGLSRDEMTGRYCYRVWERRDDPCPGCPVVRAIRTGEISTIEKQTHDGRFWRITGAPITNEKGEVVKAIEITEDISAQRINLEKRRQAEEELRAGEKKYREILEEIQDVYYRTDKHGKLIMASPSAAEVFGYDSVEDMYGLDVAREFYADPSTREEFLKDLKKEGRVSRYEVELKKRDGSSFTVLTSSHFYYDHEGNVQGVEGLLFDISERKEAEEKLEKKNEELKARSRSLAQANRQKEIMVRRLKNMKDALHQLLVRNSRLINSMNQLLIGIDQDGRIFQWNKKAEELLGISSSDVLGKYLHQCKVEWDWERVNELIRKVRDGKRRVSGEDISYQRIDGAEGLMNMNVSFAVDDEDVKDCLILAADVTEQRNIEMQLNHARKMESIGQLAAGIAHEINTPMQYINDNTSFLKDAFGDFSELADNLRSGLSQWREGGGEAEYAERMKKSLEVKMEETDMEFLLEEVPTALEQTFEGIRRVNRIVNSMKEFCHSGSREKTPVDINRAVDAAISISRNEWKYVAEMETCFSESLPEVPCLPDEINQVFLNLIINAAHAIEEKMGEESEKKGRIIISTAREGDMVVIRVDDTGTGIAEEDRDRIFDPFYTTRDVGKGSGQGLALAHSTIVDKHGGSLTFSSQAGEGTEFTIKLPLRPDNECGAGKN